MIKTIPFTSINALAADKVKFPRVTTFQPTSITAQTSEGKM